MVLLHIWGQALGSQQAFTRKSSSTVTFSKVPVLSVTSAVTVKCSCAGAVEPWLPGQLNSSQTLTPSCSSVTGPRQAVHWREVVLSDPRLVWEKPHAMLTKRRALCSLAAPT